LSSDITETPSWAGFDSGKLTRAHGDGNGRFFKAGEMLKELQR
jgi:hypothetical protein